MRKSLMYGLPKSITFGYKVLQVPSLEEMGIPMAGHGYCSSTGLEELGRWVNRGEFLFVYEFDFFEHARKSLRTIFRDPLASARFEILSPISGLFLWMRNEKTMDLDSNFSLTYQSCTKRLLPVILVPNDEPLPAVANFDGYERMAGALVRDFDLIPIRDPTKSRPERLRDWIAGNDDSTAKHYLECLTALRERNHDSYRAYEIRELTGMDKEIIDSVQDLRSEDVLLREKLVHIARKFGKSI